MKAYKIKIEFIGTEPLIWREVIMPAGATFNRLHDTIQTVTNFQSGYPDEPCHLFEFNLSEEKMKITNDSEAYDENKIIKSKYKKVKLDKKKDPFGIIAKHLNTTIRKPQSIKIDKYIEKYEKLNYRYDFGDDWRMLITLEEIIEDYYYGYPTLIDGAETAPPEDVGGVLGYYEFFKVYHDENHPDYENIKKWAEEQRYREYDNEWTNIMLKHIKYKKTEWDKINEADKH
ncbi:plasmid pRiA4b ORF-3 family protein [Oceanirhabdus sp. W0125-5]|uniref:plasmid pRiA4b ORF-3 family protein n=1 Tax=Oceanirhabdus sp. W0125-5 TaxID=2999116 RepID=UPI0022F2FDB3|nr:plasmid pRiA4b ORF-3 family protein [Oceanirhabdus sp. W0125-5]WBW96208.1 plasmid pRiA4b ORF-3 family protein [Oceanirhabdus sp. W0125-5]